MIRYLNNLNTADFHRELLFMDNPPEICRLQEKCPQWLLKTYHYSEKELQELAALLSPHIRLSIHYSVKQPSEAYLFFYDINKTPLLRHLSTFSDSQKSALTTDLSRLLHTLLQTKWQYPLHDQTLSITQPLIMGILNITPDSFSDGGHFIAPDAACRHAAEMLAAGAAIIDIGGESSRPGSTPISLAEEWTRIQPVLKQMVKIKNIIISIDTYKSEIARRALQEGAHMINDISGLTADPEMAAVAADFQAPVILMHLKGAPKTMQQNPSYDNLMEEIWLTLQERCTRAQEQGIQKLIIDPGIGFGKRLDDNFEIIRRLSEFKTFGYPILLGPSRKAFIGSCLNLPPEKRLNGTLASLLYGVSQGANILRVHDAAATQQALTIYQAIETRKADGYSAI